MKLLLLTALVSLSTAASANPFAEVKLGQPVCYGREYSTEHMLSHPNQTVRQMKIKAYKDQWVGEDSIYLEIKAEVRREATDSESGEKYQIYKPYGTAMGCKQSPDKLECWIDCDGGEAQVSWQVRSGRNTVHLVNKGFVMYGGCGEDTDDTIFLKALEGGDDIFKLFALPKEYCQQ